LFLNDQLMIPGESLLTTGFQPDHVTEINGISMNLVRTIHGIAQVQAVEAALIPLRTTCIHRHGVKWRICLIRRGRITVTVEHQISGIRGVLFSQMRTFHNMLAEALDG